MTISKDSFLGRTIIALSRSQMKGEDNMDEYNFRFKVKMDKYGDRFSTITVQATDIGNANDKVDELLNIDKKTREKEGITYNLLEVYP